MKGVLARVPSSVAFGIGLGMVSLASVAAAQTVTVKVAPASVSLKPNATQQFTDAVAGTTNTAVTWLVNGVHGGTPSTGTVTAAGLYTAPADPAATLGVTIEAVPAAAPTVTGTAKATIAAAVFSGPSYTVSTAGNDSNTGTAAAPWRTIQHAVNTVPAGATILVETGVYNELVTITRSGSASAGFITVTAAPGAVPVVDGTGLGIPNGQNGLFTISSASYIRIKGFEIRNYVSGNTNVPCGIYVEGAGNHIEILGNHIHNITTTLKTTAGNALGIAVYGTEAPAGITWLTIDRNELDNLTTGYSESLSLSGNVARWQVTDNLIHDNDNIGINIEGFYQTAPDPAYDQARNGLVAGNTVYNITSKNNPSYGGSLGADGIYLSGAASVTVAQNLVYQTDYGIELASEIHGRATSNSLVHDNVIYHSYLSGITIGGADPTQNGGTTGCTIANNTLFENDTTQSGSGEIQIQYNASGNSFLNNIAYANAQGLMVNSFSTSATRPANFNYNLYFSPDGKTGSQWIWRNVTYTAFGAYKTGSGNDAEGQFADPRFVSLTTPDLNVASTSPAISHGSNLGLIREGLVDFAGHPRLAGAAIDIGAYEH